MGAASVVGAAGAVTAVTAVAAAASAVAATEAVSAQVAAQDDPAAAESAATAAALRARDYECSGCARDDFTVVTLEELAAMFKRVGEAAAAAPQVPPPPFDVLSMVGRVLSWVRPPAAA